MKFTIAGAKQKEERNNKMQKIKNGIIKPEQRMPPKGIDKTDSSIKTRKHTEKKSKPFQGKSKKQEESVSV